MATKQGPPRPTPPPAAPPARRYTEGPWRVESRGTGEYDVITERNGRVGGYMRLADARLLAAAPRMLRTLEAVLHQMEHGEASDFLDGENLIINGDTGAPEFADARRDLMWCRRELQQTLKILS